MPTKYKRKTKLDLGASITRVLRKNAEEIRIPKPTLTRADWVEIYYALEHKLSSPALQGDDSLTRHWRRHLKDILETIGPDGMNMVSR